MDVELARRVVEQKALARTNQTRRNRIRLAGLLAGSALAALWFLLVPDGAPEPGLKLLIGTVGGFTLTDIAMALRSERLFPERARCPACGHDWEIKEGSNVPLREMMPTWDKCPGCGLLMSDLSLFLILKRSES
jgi:hypothetical protein